jgi:hypothetical protein
VKKTSLICPIELLHEEWIRGGAIPGRRVRVSFELGKRTLRLPNRKARQQKISRTAIAGISVRKTAVTSRLAFDQQESRTYP